MKRLGDFDEFAQAIPKSKELRSFETQYARDPIYVTQKEFTDMQDSLTRRLEEQITVLEQVLIELRMSRIHLAGMSGENVDSSDTDEESG